MSGPTAPIASKKPHARTLHGEVVHDPWFWLRDKSDPDVIAHIEAENDYTAHILGPTTELQESIFNEIRIEPTT